MIDVAERSDPAPPLVQEIAAALSQRVGVTLWPEPSTDYHHYRYRITGPDGIDMMLRLPTQNDRMMRLHGHIPEHNAIGRTVCGIGFSVNREADAIARDIHRRFWGPYAAERQLGRERFYAAAVAAAARDQLAQALAAVGDGMVHGSAQYPTVYSANGTPRVRWSVFGGAASAETGPLTADLAVAVATLIRDWPGRQQ